MILTTAVVAIIFTAPLGAIFINTFGNKWLSHDGEIAAVIGEIEVESVHDKSKMENDLRKSQLEKEVAELEIEYENVELEIY